MIGGEKKKKTSEFVPPIELNRPVELNYLFIVEKSTRREKSKSFKFVVKKINNLTVISRAAWCARLLDENAIIIPVLAFISLISLSIIFFFGERRKEDDKFRR